KPPKGRYASCVDNVVSRLAATPSEPGPYPARARVGEEKTVPIEITVPRQGWSMEEGVFVEWRKHNGDCIQPGDALYLLESEKSTEEIEALEAGILCIPPD